MGFSVSYVRYEYVYGMLVSCMARPGLIKLLKINMDEIDSLRSTHEFECMSASLFAASDMNGTS